MTSESYPGARIFWNESRQLIMLALGEPTNGSPNNIKANRLHYPQITSPNFTAKFGNQPPFNGAGKIYTFPAKDFGNYTGYGITLLTGSKQIDKVRDDFINADQVHVRLEIDGRPTTITFNDNPGLIQQRQAAAAGQARLKDWMDTIQNAVDSGKLTFQQVSIWQQQGHNLEAIAKHIKDNIKENVNQGVAEEYNAEYDDEAGMADNNLSTLRRAVEGLDDLIDAGDNLPEWCQEKIAVAKSMLVSVWDYMESEDDAEEEFDLIESIIDRIAAQNGVDSELVWEDLESLTEDELYAFAVTSQLNEDWSKVNKKDKTDGMSQKAVNAYRRENPGSKLKTAVTTKPSKLKKGSKASKRRKSYCSRSKGQMNMHNISCAKTPDKAICKARRRWNC
jgi:hypothetical protein